MNRLEEEKTKQIGPKCLEFYMSGLTKNTYYVNCIKVSKINVIFYKNRYLELFADADEKKLHNEYIESEKFLKSPNSYYLKDPFVMMKYYNDFLDSKDLDILYDDRKMSYINRFLNRFGEDEGYTNLKEKMQALDTDEFALTRLSTGKINIKKCGKFEIIYKRVLKMDDMEEIINYLSSIGVDYYYFNSCITSFIASQKLMDVKEKEKILPILKNIAKAYSNYTLDKRRQEVEKVKDSQKVLEDKKNLKVATAYVDGFLNSRSDDIEKYRVMINLDKKTANYYLKIVKEFLPDTYKKVLSRSSVSKSSYHINTKEIIRKISTGKYTDDRNIEYDILDFYLDTGVSLDDFENNLVSKKSTTTEISIFKKFKKANESYMMGKNEIEKTINSYTEINSDKDSNGFPIYGTGRVITSDEKLSIFDYLRNNNIPITLKTYKVAFKRFREDRLFNSLDKDKSYTKKKA